MDFKDFESKIFEILASNRSFRERIKIALPIKKKNEVFLVADGAAELFAATHQIWREFCRGRFDEESREIKKTIISDGRIKIGRILGDEEKGFSVTIELQN